jgi:hypothetical protein
MYLLGWINFKDILLKQFSSKQYKINPELNYSLQSLQKKEAP